MNNDYIGQPLEITIAASKPINMEIQNEKDINLSLGESKGTTNYVALSNKPQINDVTLIGNKTSKELHLEHELDVITPQEIDTMIFG